MEERNWSPIGKKHNWVQRDGGDITYELCLFEGNRKIDRFVWNTKKKFFEILELIRLKYGMDYK